MQRDQAERKRREQMMLAKYPDKELGEMNYSEELAIEARYGLYCPVCQHGNGCRHGVPVSKW